VNDLNVGEAYHSFQSLLSATIDMQATERTIRISAKWDIYEAWVIPDLLRPSKTLDKPHRKQMGKDQNKSNRNNIHTVKENALKAIK